MTKTINEYVWWAGSDEQHFDSEYSTREEAIEVGKDEYDHEDGFHICEAIVKEQRLSEYFCIEWFMEYAEERAYDLHTGESEDELFKLKKEEQASLEFAIKSSIEKWQVDNKKTFIPFMFTHTRNSEYITISPES